MTNYDFIIIGGGIVGLSTGMAILKQNVNAKVLVLEKEKKLAAHQTGRNSGVMHSGIYYKHGSFKAKFAVEGRKKLIHYCDENGIKYDLCGKIIVATSEEEIPELEKLYVRAQQNGLKVQKISKEEIKEVEPYANGISAIKLPMTGIVDYTEVSESFAQTIINKGGEIKTGTKAINVRETDDLVEVETNNGVFQGKLLINCAGLFSDRIAKLAGLSPDVKIVPFKGEYFKLTPEKSYLIKNLIYPVPNPKFPFLGVHLTRMMNGEIHAGPNAVLSFKREGYNKMSFSLKDTLEIITYPAFWKLARAHLRYGIDEMMRSLSKKLFLKSVQRLVPEIQIDDLVPAEPGIRAQALMKDGQLIDDFLIINGKRSIHVCNAPSPAATASISIGEYIANYINNEII
jgi:(S)-2-hydroxyglutarate dehydrogenase